MPSTHPCQIVLITIYYVYFFSSSSLVSQGCFHYPVKKQVVSHFHNQLLLRRSLAKPRRPSRPAVGFPRREECEFIIIVMTERREGLRGLIIPLFMRVISIFFADSHSQQSLDFSKIFDEKLSKSRSRGVSLRKCQESCTTEVLSRDPKEDGQGKEGFRLPLPPPRHVVGPSRSS